MAVQQPKKIGAYLVEGRAVDQASLEQALAKQARLEKDGRYMPTGEIMALSFLLILVGSLLSQMVLKKLLLAPGAGSATSLPQGWRWPVLIPTVIYLWLPLA
jgi:hypothetical protein